MPTTLTANSSFPKISFPKVGGGELSVGEASDKWTLFVVYRGKHCGRCKPYLTGLEAIKSQWEDAGYNIVVASADTEEKAAADIAEFGWTFDIGYGLTVEQMRELGLFISTPLTESETDRPFAEPGVFCITPEGKTQIVAISNGPAARPDLEQLLDGMIFTIKHNRPARGDLS